MLALEIHFCIFFTLVNILVEKVTISVSFNEKSFSKDFEIWTVKLLGISLSHKTPAFGRTMAKDLNPPVPDRRYYLFIFFR